jgi:hypothetical protein
MSLHLRLLGALYELSKGSFTLYRLRYWKGDYDDGSTGNSIEIGVSI